VKSPGVNVLKFVETLKDKRYNWNRGFQCQPKGALFQRSEIAGPASVAFGEDDKSFPLHEAAPSFLKRLHGLVDLSFGQGDDSPASKYMAPNGVAKMGGGFEGGNVGWHGADDGKDVEEALMVPQQKVGPVLGEVLTSLDLEGTAHAQELTPADETCEGKNAPRTEYLDQRQYQKQSKRKMNEAETPEKKRKSPVSQ